MKNLLKKLIVFFIVFFVAFAINNTCKADINLDMKVNSYGLLEDSDNGTTYGIGYGISTVGGLNTNKDLQNTMQSILSIVLGFAGTISLIFVIIGGINIVTSNGNKEKYGKNMKLMLTGAVAFLIILFAYAVSRLILGFLGGIA